MESGEQLGVLECGPKRSGPLNAHDRQLLGALGREAALRLRTVSQADELEVRLDQIERQAVEIAASRARIVEAQDEERRRIERDLHDGVQQELASLIGKLRLAINQIAVSPEQAATTIATAQDDVRRTLGDVRAIAQGIHPAILDDQGIVRGDRGAGQAASARGDGGRGPGARRPTVRPAGSRAPPTSSLRRRSPTSSSTPRRRWWRCTWASTGNA